MLKAKVIVVTGPDGGIGPSVVEACLEAGGTVVAVHRPGRDFARRSGCGDGQLVHRIADVTDAEMMNALAASVEDEMERIDGVVALVGRRPAPRPLQETTPRDWSAILATNLTSTFVTFRAFVPAMLRQRGGSLVAVGSIAGRRGSAGQAAYAGAKAGVAGLVRALASELGPVGIRVNTVTPGGTRTERTLGIVAQQADERGIDPAQVERELVAGVALGRLVRPGEIGDACVFLLSDRSSGITGEELNVSGGAVMW